MSATGESDNAESISEPWSKIVVDVPRFAEASQEHQGRPMAPPIDDFKTDIPVRVARHGNEPDVLCRRIGPGRSIGSLSM